MVDEPSAASFRAVEVPTDESAERRQQIDRARFAISEYFGGIRNPAKSRQAPRGTARPHGYSGAAYRMFAPLFGSTPENPLCAYLPVTQSPTLRSRLVYLTLMTAFLIVLGLIVIYSIVQPGPITAVL